MTMIMCADLLLFVPSSRLISTAQAMRQAENDVQKANNDRAAAMRDANNALEQAKKDATAGINSAISDLDGAQDYLNRNFGKYDT